MTCACIDFRLQVPDIIKDIRGFQVAFGIAGSQDIEVSMFFDKGDQIAGMAEVSGHIAAGRHVAAKSQDVLDACLLEIGQLAAYIGFCQADAGQMSHAFYAVFILDPGGNL